jgi:hypothetical protein
VAGQKDRPVMLDSASDDLTQRMERLPPGHPSSPYDEDGTRKPPVPRTTVRELPLPDEIDGDAGPDESAEPAVPDSPPEGDTDQGSLDTHDLTDKKQASFEAAGQDAAGREAGQDAAGQDAGREAAGREAGQDAGKGKTGADKASESDAQDGEASVTGPPTPETSPPDSRSWWQALPHLKEQWEHHKERWPQEQHQPADRSNDEPNSWRGDSGRTLNPRDNAQVEAGCDRIAQAESRITDRMEDAERASEGLLAGKEFRLKDRDRLKDKVAAAREGAPGADSIRILANIHDAVRYTLQYDDSDYAERVQSAVGLLKNRGFDLIKLKNFWDDSEYKGINSQWLDRGTGQTFEMQFHTPISFEAKQVSHKAYERLRNPRTTEEESGELHDYQREVSSKIPKPIGAADIQEFP